MAATTTRHRLRMNPPAAAKSISNWTPIDRTVGEMPSTETRIPPVSGAMSMMPDSVGVSAHLLLAWVAGGRWLALLIASDILFAIGRLSFYRCCSYGAGARALGRRPPSSLTCYLATIAVLIARLFGG